MESSKIFAKAFKFDEDVFGDDIVHILQGQGECDISPFDWSGGAHCKALSTECDTTGLFAADGRGYKQNGSHQQYGAQNLPNQGSFHVLRRTGEALQTASRIHQQTPCKRRSRDSHWKGLKDEVHGGRFGADALSPVGSRALGGDSTVHGSTRRVGFCRCNNRTKWRFRL